MQQTFLVKSITIVLYFEESVQISVAKLIMIIIFVEITLHAVTQKTSITTNILTVIIVIAIANFVTRVTL